MTAARRIYRSGIDFLLLEARDRLGGRILSADATGQVSDDGFDLGPSWFWPGTQSAMAALVGDLGLSHFPQNSDGDVIFQRMSHEVPQRRRGMRQEPQSMRLVGGTGAIIAALSSAIPKASIRLGVRVTHVALSGPDVEVGFVDADSVERRMRVAHVLFAMPPRLLEATVSFRPALDEATTRCWRDTPTWMAPHAKLFALYDRPFWRDAGLSGAAQSMVGPLVEIHDATTASGQAALFGFVGVSAVQRVRLGPDATVAAAIEQLAYLFGPQAGKPRATLFKDWAADPLTATADDLEFGGYPVPAGLPWVGGDWRDRISLAGSETSRSEPGYLSGAVEAAERAVTDLTSRFWKPEDWDFAPPWEADRETNL